MSEVQRLGEKQKNNSNVCGECYKCLNYSSAMLSAAGLMYMQSQFKESM